MGVDESYNFRRVTDRLTTSGHVSAAHLRGLRSEGYDAVINLLPDSHAHAVSDEAFIVQGQGLDYVYIPVDFDSPTHADLEAFTDAMDARSDMRVHVHCAANYRVSAFYALYALRRGRFTVAEADQFTQDLWDPADHPAWRQFVADERSRRLEP